MTMELLNKAKEKTLPQNSRNDIVDRTPDGLDKRIKESLKTDLRTANIVSDVLEEASIAKVVSVVNPNTGKSVKGTKLLRQWYW